MNVDKQKNDEIIKIIMLINNYDSDTIRNIRKLFGNEDLPSIIQVRVFLENLRTMDVLNKHEIFGTIINLIKNKSLSLIDNTFNGTINNIKYEIDPITGNINRTNLEDIKKH